MARARPTTPGRVVAATESRGPADKCVVLPCCHTTSIIANARGEVFQRPDAAVTIIVTVPTGRAHLRRVQIGGRRVRIAR